MQSGKLRDRVTLQKPSVTNAARDASGQIIDPWETVATVYADVQDMNARELNYARQSQSLASVKVSLRYRTDVTAEWRLLHGARAFNIEGVTNPDGVRCETLLACVEQKTGGA